MAKIHAAMLAVMRDLEAIGKDRDNEMQGFKYRGIDDLYNALHGPLAKNGVVILPQVVTHEVESFDKDSGGKVTRWWHARVTLKLVFSAEDGSTVEAVSCAEGLDNSDKATNKALSLAYKYGIFQIFCIPTEDQIDGDAETPKAEGQKPPDAPTGTMKDHIGPKHTEAENAAFRLKLKHNEIKNIIEGNNWNLADAMREPFKATKKNKIEELDADESDRAIVYLKKLAGRVKK